MYCIYVFLAFIIFEFMNIEFQNHPTLFFVQLLFVCYIYLAEYKLFIFLEYFFCMSSARNYTLPLDYFIILEPFSLKKKNKFDFSFLGIIFFLYNFSVVVNFQFSSTKHVFVHTFPFVFSSQTQQQQQYALVSINKNQIKWKMTRKKNKNTIGADFRYEIPLCMKNQCSFAYFFLFFSLACA